MKTAVCQIFFLFTWITIMPAQVSFEEPKAATEYFFAHQVEEVSGQDECYIISFTPVHSNKTLTIRDDKVLGVFYYVTGPDCQTVFDKKFEKLPSRSDLMSESYTSPKPDIIDPLNFSKIRSITRYQAIGPGGTHLYLVYLYADSHTTDPRDDVFLGLDFVIDSSDPDVINSGFDLGELEKDLALYPDLKELISSNSYYKLREMIVNEKLIVESLRHDHALQLVSSLEK